MRQIRIDYQGTPAGRPHPPMPAPAPRQARPQPAKTRRCERHPGVHMVLAGYKAEWNTVRYLCPMCNAMGLPPIEVATGVVNAYFPERGYGFIENGGPRIFFHLSDLVSNFTPHVGSPVTCIVEQNAKGLVGRQVAPR